ncbi:MAG: carotenoid biosynthesis protein [Nitrospira sp.]|nr:carotenoid biosynthesis protein [Nitrospira sp.]
MTLLLSTLLLRPYVFIFFAIFIGAAIRFLGWRKTLLFTGISWAIAFIAEFSSTRNGIPFGYYVYIESTRDQELWLSNVPFFDSLSFTFLAYASYIMSLSFTLPTVKKGMIARFLDDFQTRSSGSVLLLSTLFFTFIDIVIDPLAVRGDRWFLGKIFYYPDPGVYFGVPFSNFVGWAVVGFMSIACFQIVEKIFNGQRHENLECDVSVHILLGILLYYLVLVFNLTMTFMIGETLLGMVGLFIYLPVTAILLVRLLGARL